MPANRIIAGGGSNESDGDKVSPLGLRYHHGRAIDAAASDVRNGTTHFFGVQTDEFRRLLVELAPDAPVAFVLHRCEAEYVPVTADRLRQFLREYTRREVVVSDELPSQYILRLVLPLIFVKEPSPLFSRISKRHPGGRHTFEKADLDRMVCRLPGDTIIGTLMTREATTSHEDLTAATLLGLLPKDTHSAIGVMEQDESSYMLVFRPRLSGLHRFVAVPSDSSLIPLLRRFNSSQRKRDERH